jgi:hypothetical protein
MTATVEVERAYRKREYNRLILDNPLMGAYGSMMKYGGILVGVSGVAAKEPSVGRMCTSVVTGLVFYVIGDAITSAVRSRKISKSIEEKLIEK